MIIITTTIANVKRRKVYVYQKANGKAPSKGRTNIEHHSIRTQYNRLKSIHLGMIKKGHQISTTTKKEMIKKDIKQAPEQKRNDKNRPPILSFFGGEQCPPNIFAFQSGKLAYGNFSHW